MRYQGYRCEDARDEHTHRSQHRHEPPEVARAVDRRVGAQVELAEQLDAVEGLQRLARDRRVEEEPQPDVERPHLGEHRPAVVARIVASVANVVLLRE